MIDKFNFYDIYGYFLPGLLLIVFGWAPVGLLFGVWPKADIGSTIFLVILAYLLGHVIQSFASKIIPSKIADGQGRLRHPSDLVLDPADPALGTETVAKVSDLSRKYFKLLLRSYPDEGTNIDAATASKNRNRAFFLARSALLRDKKSSYWEQFEGLYALMRGSTAALSAACAYFVGWFAALVLNDLRLPSSRNAVAGFVFLFLLLLAFLHSLVAGTRPSPSEPETAEQRASARFTVQILRVSTLLLALLAGALMAWNSSRPVAKHPSLFSVMTIVTPGSDAPGEQSGFQLGTNQAFLLLVLALVAALAAARCYEQYKGFAREFAIAIWRDFAVIDFAAAPARDDLHV